MKHLKKYLQIFESKKTESQANEILLLKGIEPSVLDILKKIDNSTNQNNLPGMSFFWAGKEDEIKSTFDIYNDLLKRGKIKPFILKDKFKTFVIEDKIFNNNDLIKFREFLDSRMPKVTIGQKGTIDTKTKDKPLWEGNGIEIYEANDIMKCIKYTKGGLTGINYSFCIGAYIPNNMFYSYRDTNVATFYFILDKNRDLSDPLHVVVYDNQQYGISLTDVNNTTGTIAEFGDNVESYQKYLEDKGVPVDKLLVNKPKTDLVHLYSLQLLIAPTLFQPHMLPDLPLRLYK